MGLECVCLAIEMNLQQLKAVFDEQKQPAFRMAQAKRAFFVDLMTGWDQVTTFSKSLREALEAGVPWTSVKPVVVKKSADGQTVKTLFECADGKKIEAVLMRSETGRNTVCLSCQVGCPMGCTFCATGTMGLVRNLTADEMVDQVLYYARELKKEDAAVTNIVYMGMGEPFHNYDEVMKSIRALHDPEGFNLGSRHFTVSTCGIVPGILKFAEEPMQVNLAISLHSAVNETRTKIMPVNRAYSVEKLMNAVETYCARTNRKVFFEYLLLKGINDTPDEARALIKLMEKNPRLYHVNLIKYHDTALYEGTPKEYRNDFLLQLKDAEIPVTHRVSFGEDIDAACGQLAVRETATGKMTQGTEAARENRQSKQKPASV